MDELLASPARTIDQIMASLGWEKTVQSEVLGAFREMKLLADNGKRSLLLAQFARAESRAGWFEQRLNEYYGPAVALVTQGASEETVRAYFIERGRKGRGAERALRFFRDWAAEAGRPLSLQAADGSPRTSLRATSKPQAVEEIGLATARALRGAVASDRRYAEQVLDSMQMANSDQNLDLALEFARLYDELIGKVDLGTANDLEL